MAGEGLINVGYDASSFATIARFAQFQHYLETEMSAVLPEVGALLVQTTQDNTWTAFQNPTGNLAGNIAYQLTGPMSLEVVVNVPYAWRLEMGYHGADSLGRIYDNPAEPYAGPALEMSQDQIAIMMGTGAGNAFAALEGR